MKYRDKTWLAAHVGCRLKFEANGQQFEGVLDFRQTMGLFCFPFFGGYIAAEICLIEDYQKPAAPEKEESHAEQ